MNPHTVVAWFGCGVLYVLIVWGLITSYRSTSARPDEHQVSVKSLVVPCVYITTIVLSIAQEGVAYPY